MPEIKHTFHAGKMDKDTDERLVKNGEYRDALNVQVRTTDGGSDGTGDAGAIQNIKGTKRVILVTPTTSYIDDNISGEKDETRIIASIADEAKDRAFFFVASPVPFNGIESISHTDIINASLNSDGDVVTGQSKRDWIDRIVELNYSPQNGGGTDYDTIFVDKWAVTCTYADAVSSPSSSTSYSYITVTNGALYREGMILYAQNSSGVDLLHHTITVDGETYSSTPGVEIVKISGNDLVLAETQTSNLQESCAVMKFIHPERVLEFDYYKSSENNVQRIHNVITGINIIDDLLFWSDGIHEPKKINIERSRKGTTTDATHTELWVTHPVTHELVKVTDIEPDLNTADIKKEHITVIRKAPQSAPTLHMDISDRENDTSFEISYNFKDNNSIPSIPTEGCTRIIPFPIEIDCREDDVFKFTSDNIFSNEPSIVRAKVINIDGTNVTVRLIFMSNDVAENDPSNWDVELEQRKPLFETKFGRFAYRYQYDDNEYSSFSPWSELAFLPGEFEYSPSKGYNKGVVNNVRSLIVKDFVPHDVIRPSDVKAIDILWKTTDNANVYIVKTITRERDVEWENYTNTITDNTGSITITSEMIHKVVPSNQTLRGWDNVPRKAVAQEMTANRLIYGNYIQGYDLQNSFGLKQSVISNRVQFPKPRKSVKSDRSYRFGAVFGDKYGRETPVMASGYKNIQLQGDNEVIENISGDLVVEKSLSAYSNKFQLEQSWDGVPGEWMDYVKYFVKETSNEYYNLIMDRWYEAEDGNIWVAFPSVDRNKVDEETFLLLKNGHGTQMPIAEEARYKIIAIENNAPDFIKTENRDYDKIYIVRDNIYSGSQSAVTDAIPDKLIEEREIMIAAEHWDAVKPNTADFKGIAKARIIGIFSSPADGDVQVESPWRNLTKIIDHDNGGDPVRGVVFNKPFEESEVNMYEKLLLELSDPSELTDNKATVDNPNADGWIQYYIQLRDAVIDNKPQFDGRFFVKLEKDSVLEKSVLGTQVSYEVQATYEVAYIAAKAENEANVSEEDDFTPGPYNNPSDATSNDWPGNVFTSAEIEYDASYNNSLTAQGPPAGESVPAGNVKVEDLTNADGEVNEDLTTNENGISEAEQTVPLFGPGDHSSNGNKTEQFWEWWWNQGVGGNTNRKSNIFIDSAPAYSGFSKVIDLVNSDDGTETKRQILRFLNSGYQPLSHFKDNYIYGPYPSGATYPYPPYDLEWDGSESKQNWSPQGLSNGHLSNGELGQFTFSVIKDDWSTSASDALFKSAMTTVGTIFRFENDPNNVNYKIISFVQNTDGDGFEGFGSFSNGQEITIESRNYANTEGSLRNRYSIITRFVRLNASNVEEPNTGIDISKWDPRGEVRHDGIGSLKIQVLTQVGNFSLSDRSLATNAACWETEPKEDIGLDIYYEASEAIPMNLKDTGDLITFTKPSANKKRASNTTLVDRTFDSSMIRPTLPSDAYVSNVLSNDAIKIMYQGYELVNGVQQPSYELPLTIDVDRPGYGLFPGDIINFIHKSSPYKSGIITNSKIIDYYDVITGLPGSTTIPTLSPRETRDGVPYAVGGQVAGAEGGGAWLKTDVGDISGNSIIGAAVTGPGLPEVGVVVLDTGYAGFGEPAVRVNWKFDNDYANVSNAYEFKISTGWYKIDTEVWRYPIELGWFNCYSFGNGVESDRIRDDFNAPTIDNGIKVSSTFLEYGKEKLGSGLIYSGLYNSTSGVNNLNEFNMAEKITKNLNPIYGSIQALKTSEKNLIVFAEDKILKVLANKDAIYNADGNPQLTATNKVLGDTTPYAGDFGISKNPESLAWDQYRMYCTDKQRGAVLRISMDGITPISDVGMRTYFRNRMKLSDSMVGTFDTVNGEYNVTLDKGWKYNTADAVPTTVSFNERSKAWTSFKSFIPSTGVSVNGRYLTANKNMVWEHYSDTAPRNNFYGTQYQSEVEVIFNDMPSVIKSFKTINYEGTQSKVIQSYNISTSSTILDAVGNSVSTDDGEYYNLTSKNGWWVQSFTTDSQEGAVPEFINKENKWFNRISGIATTESNLDMNEFSVQGIGFPSTITSASTEDASVPTAGDEVDFIIEDTYDGVDTGIYGDDSL